MHNQQQPNYDQYPQEIDLVDLAVVVYRRKWTLVLAVLFSVIIACGYWASSGDELKVSAVLQIGEEAILDSGELSVEPLMSAPDTAQLLKRVYLPALLLSTEFESGIQTYEEDIEINYVESRKGFEKKTSVLELFSEGTQKESQVLVTIIDGSLELLLKNHTDKLDEYRSGVLSLIESEKNKLLLLKQLSTPETPNEGLAERSLVEANILSLNNVLSASTHSKIIKSASAEPAESKGPVVYVAAGLVSGLFIGCFLVFFLELYAKAKIRAEETA